eukprot:11095272-Alexandrium_andersonii.AAC.1
MVARLEKTRPDKRKAEDIAEAQEMAVGISRQFSTSWGTLSASTPVVRHPLLPGVAVVECGTDGACGWNAVA